MALNTGGAYSLSAPISLEIGNKRLDNEHASLFELLEKLLKIARTESVESEAFSEVFSRIGQDLALHIDHEESLFFGSGMPETDITDHIQAHVRIMEEFSRLNMDLMQGKRLENATFALTARQWILNHLVDYDLKLRPFVADKPESRACRKAHSHNPIF